MTTSPNLDTVFDALANEARRDIVVRLSRGRSTTPELGRDFAMSKQALNRHIRVLEEAGLVERRLRGRVHELTLVPDQLEGVSGWARSIRQNWSLNLDRLETVLDGGHE